MRVPITGAGGTLGTALAPLLAEAGHEPVLFDVRALDTEFASVQGDVLAPGRPPSSASGVSSALSH